MVDVFISYSKVDEGAVRQLAGAVRRLGYSVWWDDELPPHLSYSDVIAEKIGAAKAAIVVWSEHAAASQWVRAEADVARSQKKLIQTSIDGRMPPMPFNQIQFAAIGDWHGEENDPAWMKVKASLEALVGPPAAAGAAAPPPSGRPAPAPAPPQGKASKLVPTLAGLLVLAMIGVGYLLWARPSQPPAPVPHRPVLAADPAIPAPPEPHAPESAHAPAQIFPDSSWRRLTREEVDDLSAAELWIARNEIFARHGRVFRDARLQRHFRRYRWYRARPGDVALTPVEEANVRLLRDAEGR
jgi:hypothetical protein